MTKYLILVKHSLPAIEEDRPAPEWKLSQEGKLRAHRLVGLLEAYRPKVIVSSPASKAKETAEIISVLPFLTGKPFSTTKDTKVTKGKRP